MKIGLAKEKERTGARRMRVHEKRGKYIGKGRRKEITYEEKIQGEQRWERKYRIDEGIANVMIGLKLHLQDGGLDSARGGQVF